MNIAESVIKYICSHLIDNGSSIALDSHLAQDVGLDSTAMLELILWIGETFDITIENEDLTPENFATPRNIAEFVKRRKTLEIADVQRHTAGNIASD